MALVITIVIIIILATITMNMVFGDNGLVEKAEQAKNMTEGAVQKEQGDLANTSVWLNEVIYGKGSDKNPGVNGEEGTNTEIPEANEQNPNNVGIDTNTVEPPLVEEIPDGDEAGAIIFGIPTWNAGKAMVTINTDTEYIIQYKVNDGEWKEYIELVTDLNNGDVVHARLTKGKNVGKETSLEIKDTILPQIILNKGTITTSTIRITVEAVDEESGMSEEINYTYYIKKSNEGENSFKRIETNTNANCTFTNLEEGISYDIKVEVQGDKAGNIGVGTMLSVTTKNLPGGETGLEQGAIKFGEIIWTEGTASISISTNTSFTLEYQIAIEAPIDDEWKTISNNENITGLNHNETVYARLTDGVNYGEYASITIKDAGDPSVEVAIGEITWNSIQINVTATDNESGLATENTYKYFLDDEEKFSTTENTYTFNQLQENTDYTIRIEVYDKAGNKVERTIQATTIEALPYIDGTLPSAPDVADGMTPVKYNGDSQKWIKTNNKDPEWYNYAEKKWANVVLGEATFNEDGSLEEDKPYTMLVWIPRYAYKITSGWHERKEGTIEIVFIDENDKDKNGIVYAGVYNSDFNNPYDPPEPEEVYSDYVVHPAFNYGNNNEIKINGLWVGKFESSHTDCTKERTTGESEYTGNEQLQIKANVTSWRNINIDQIYTTCLELNRSGNPYGLNTDDNIVDPHMLKNTEWGAVAYLSKSKYGKETEAVYVNSNSNYITGISSDYKSGGINTSTTNSYKTTKGQKASTNRQYNRNI